MTNASNTLYLMSDIEFPTRKKFFDDFYSKWKKDPLVVDKWFAIQSSSYHPDVLSHVKELIQHPDFDLLNPNRSIRTKAVCEKQCSGFPS